MKKLFYLLLLPLAVACGNEETPVGTTPEEPKLDLLSEAVMEFGAEGGDGEIVYNLVKGENTQGKSDVPESSESPVNIKSDVEWITINTDECYSGCVKFSVAENSLKESRTGKITVGYSTKSFDVVVNQAAGIDAPVIEGWAVVGSMTNNWDVASGIAMETIDGYYVARGVEVASTDSFKFVLDGSLQNSLGSNGQGAERDYKYPTSKYGSDIRVKESGTYDLYLNEALDTYYVMSEGKTPAEANEVIAQGDDIWYVRGIAETQRMRKSGIYQVATSVALDEDGFTLYHSLTDQSYGAAKEATAELGEEIAIEAGSSLNIMANVESGKVYDIYFSVEMSTVWVMPRGDKPTVLQICDYAEGVWFDGKNFLLYLETEGLHISLDCNSAVANENSIIPAATYTVDGEDGNVINVNLCEIANEDGKSPVVGGSVKISHIDGGYDILIDVLTVKQHRILAQYTGEVKSNPYMGGYITNPTLGE